MDPRPNDSFIATRLFGWEFTPLSPNETRHPWKTPWGEAAFAPEYSSNFKEMHLLIGEMRSMGFIHQMGDVIPEYAERAKDGSLKYFCEFGKIVFGKTRKWNAFGKTQGEAVVAAAIQAINGEKINNSSLKSVEDIMRVQLKHWCAICGKECESTQLIERRCECGVGAPISCNYPTNQNKG